MHDTALVTVMRDSDYLMNSSHEKIEDKSLGDDYQGMFHKLDLNNDGQLTLEEFRNIAKTLNHPVSKNDEFIDKVFASADTDNDKTINFEDFKSYLTATDEQIMEGFNKIDLNNDGKVNQSEFEIYLRESLHLKPSKAEVTKLFSKIDTCNRGYINSDEFRNFLLLVPRLEGSRVETVFNLLVNMVDVSADGDVNLPHDVLIGVGFFLAGGISGVISRTCTAPFDRIKVFLISRADLSSIVLNSREKITKAIGEGASPRAIEETKRRQAAKIAAVKQIAEKPKTIRSPLIQAARTIWLQGGFKAFYVGNGLNVVKVFPESAVKLGVFEATKRFFGTLEGVSDTSQLSSFSTYLAGGIGGVCGQLTVYPIDTLKFRLQCSNISSDVRGNELLIKLAKDLYKEGGVRQFYRGIFAGLGGMFPYAALDLGTFTSLKYWFVARESKKSGIREEDVKLPNYIVLSLGAFSGSFGATAVYPVNLIRTRLQAQGTYAHPYTYDGFFDAFRKTVAREGYPGLFKGLVPNLAKVAPAVSISYLVYENLKYVFKLERP